MVLINSVTLHTAWLLFGWVTIWVCYQSPRSTQPGNPSMVGSMNSSLWAMGWKPCVADWGGGMSASCTVCGSNCSLAWTIDDYKMYHRVINSCQSAVTSETVKRTGLESDSLRGTIATYLTFTFTPQSSLVWHFSSQSQLFFNSHGNKKKWPSHLMWLPHVIISLWLSDCILLLSHWV